MKYLVVINNCKQSVSNTKEELKHNLSKIGTAGWRNRLVEDGKLKVYEIEGEVTDEYLPKG